MFLLRLRFPASICKLKTIFQEECPVRRIKTFAQMEQQNFEQFKSKKQTYRITMPSKIKLTNAKQLRQFIQQNKVPENIRILHALAHIQFNAFLAYADTCIRFIYKIVDQNRDLFYSDMKSIAKDQGRHFLMLDQRLKELGYNYGDIPVISNLTQTILQTQNDLKARLASISIVHEGRGIKSIKRLINKLIAHNDTPSIQILKQIEDQQGSHFQMGRYWFMKILQNQQLSLNTALQQIIRQHRINIREQDLDLLNKFSKPLQR